MNSSAQRSAVLGKAKREKIKEEEKKKLAALSGASTPEEFKANLQRTYGNLLKAWKALDKDGGGSLSFVEFCKSARDHGYAGNLKELWKHFDADDEGFIQFDEFCPEIAKLLTSFKQHLRDKHEGSLVKAWKQSLDTDRSGQLTKEELIAAMKKLEWDGNAGRVYDLYDYDHLGFVTLEVIDEKASQAMARGDDLLGLDVEEPTSGKRKSEMTFEERSMTESQRRAKAQGKAKKKEIAEKAKAKAAA